VHIALSDIMSRGKVSQAFDQHSFADQATEWCRILPLGPMVSIRTYRTDSLARSGVECSVQQDIENKSVLVNKEFRITYILIIYCQF